MLQNCSRQNIGRYLMTGLLLDRLLWDLGVAWQWTELNIGSYLLIGLLFDWLLWDLKSCMAVDCKCWWSFTGWQFDPLLRDHRRGTLRSLPGALSVHGTTAGNWLYAQAGPQRQLLWNCTVRKRVAGFLIFNSQSTPVKGYWGSERGGRGGGWGVEEMQWERGEKWRVREREREREMYTHTHTHAPTYSQTQR